MIDANWSTREQALQFVEDVGRKLATAERRLLDAIQELDRLEDSVSDVTYGGSRAGRELFTRLAHMRRQITESQRTLDFSDGYIQGITDTIDRLIASCGTDSPAPHGGR